MLVKFRALRKEDKKMFFDVQNTYDYGAYGLPLPFNHFGELLKSKDYIVMQFTGILDFENKEIYIGDIVEYFVDWDKRIERMVVEFRKGCFMANGFYLHRYAGLKNSPLKIIGHIYEK